MPIFEYACRDCSSRFERLSRRDETPTCRSCGSQNLEKQLSVFAVSAAGGSMDFGAESPGACGSCGDPRGPGSCSMN